MAIRKVMGKHYRSDTKTPFMWAFWKNQRECKFVEETVQGSGIWFFRNLHGMGERPRDLTGGKATAGDVKVAEKERETKGASAMSTAMSSSRNMEAKRRFSQGLATMAQRPLLVAE